MFISTFRKKINKFFGLTHYGGLEISDASAPTSWIRLISLF